MYGLSLIFYGFLRRFWFFVKRGHTTLVCDISSMRNRAVFYSIFAISFFKRRIIFFSNREM